VEHHPRGGGGDIAMVYISSTFYLKKE